MNKFHILALVKDSDWGLRVEEFLNASGQIVKIFRGKRGDPFPDIEETYEIDILISFSSQWIIPKYILDKSKICAINFHPGSPEYPGIGCTNFAIYNNAEEFGVTCHHMDPTVDTGKIIATKYFPLFKEDSVLSLTHRSYGYLFSLFIEVMNSLLYKEKLLVSNEIWKRKPYTRQELNELCETQLNMSTIEIERRLKATKYPGMPGAYLKLGTTVLYGEDILKEKLISIGIC
jgi:methionyl-tRNA formyltransferase